MKRTVASAVVVAATVALTVTACSSSKSSSGTSGISTNGTGKTLTVWLQSDAQKGWPAVVDQANQRFEQATGAKVNIQWQQWSNYTTKLDSTFRGFEKDSDLINGLDRFSQRAYDIISSPRSRQAFDTSQEKPEVAPPPRPVNR